MTNDNAPHPGAMIRDELRSAGFSIPKAAVAMALNRANLNNVVLGKAALSRDLAYRLSALLNPDDESFGLAKLLIDRQAQHDWGREAAVRKLALVTVAASRAHAAKVD
jgi:plasmid maintenance system antidote protein VapI